MLNIIIFGAPGSGKGTQSAFLKEKYGLSHISTGEVLRAERDAGSEVGHLAENFMSKGHLIPDEIMSDILARVYDQKTQESGCKGIVFDGFPRTIPQGIALDKILTERNQTVDAVISMEVAEEELIARMIKRGKETGRTDDNNNIIKARLDVYYNQTAPLKEFYNVQNKLHIIEGLGTKEEISACISSIINNL